MAWQALPHEGHASLARRSLSHAALIQGRLVSVGLAPGLVPAPTCG